MKKGRKLWEKTLAWVLAVVCCLSIINLAPVAQKASAAQPANTSAGTVHANMSEGYNYSSVQSKFEEDKENGIYYANAILYDYFNETQVAAYQNGTNKWTVSKTAFDQNDVKDSDLNWHYEGSWKIGQFETFNASLVRDYKFPGGQQSATSLIYHPLYVQAAENIVEWTEKTQNNDWSWRKAPGLQYIYSRAVKWGYLYGEEPAANTNGGANLWEWRLNHGLDGQTGSGDLSHASVQGIVNSKLGPNGELLSNNDGARSNGNLVVMPQFDAEYLESAKIGTTYGSLADPLGFPFRKDTTREGYYVYNSSVDGTGYNDNAYLVNNDGNYSLSYVRSNSASDRVLDTKGNPGYFPFNDKDQSVATNGRHVINYGFGTRMDIPFKIPSNSSEEIIFHFSGDDDLWVFVDGELALDLGGAHAKSEGTINFSTGEATANQAISGAGSADVGAKTSNLSASQTSTSTQHVMTIYYMERGLCESNLMVEFNFIPVTTTTGLRVTNDVDLTTINSGFLTGLQENDFRFLYDVYDATVWAAAGSGSAGKDTFYVDSTYGAGRVYFDGDGSKTASVKRDITAGETSLYGDQMKVTQDAPAYINGTAVYGLFDTTFDLTDTTGQTIYDFSDPEYNTNGNANCYNVVDGEADGIGGSTADIYFTLKDKGAILSEQPDNLTLTAAFTNTARVTSLTIEKEDNSISYADTNTYTFTVSYSQLLGVTTSGLFKGGYTIINKNTNVETPATTTDGTITIHAYEKAVITGVPVFSKICVSENDISNYMGTSVKDSNNFVTALAGNNIYFEIAKDTTLTYGWTINNGDPDALVYYAEVGTPIVISGNADSINHTGTATETFRYDQEGSTVTKPSVPTSSTGGMDLIVSDVKWSVGGVEGAAIAAGDRVVFTFEVKNIGDADVPSGTKIGLSFADPNDGSKYLWSDTNYGGLAAGATVDLTINSGDAGNAYITAPGSAFTVTATIDDQNLFSEVNEGNNTYTFTMPIPYVLGTYTEESKTYSYTDTLLSVNRAAATDAGTTLDANTSAGTVTYTSAETGVDGFYYTVRRVTNDDIYVGSHKVKSAGDVINASKTIPVLVYNYELTDNTFVVDYGLPIDTSSILSDDTLSITGAATTTNNLGVSEKANPHKGSLSKYTTTDANITPGAKADVTYGRATYASNAYKYIPEKFLDAVDTFYYAEQVVANGATGTLDASKATPVMTAAVKIIPANVVYYEDSFSYTTSNETGKSIKYTGNVSFVDNTGVVTSVTDDATQSNDQNALYGFDPAYENQLTDSLGHSLALYADENAANGAMAEFTFKGTGFDIISRTSGSTAGVVYTVFKDDALEKYGMIDTNYKNGELYQLPVISVTDLEYGTHTVKVKAVKTTASGDNGIFYFDGIRIYNPLPSLDRTGWTAEASSSDNGVTPAMAFDNDISTRWSTGAYQAPGQWFIVDMKEAKTFDTIEMLLGLSAGDYPAAYSIFVSNDGTNWGTPVKTGTNENTEKYYVGPQTARYIKVEQTGSKGVWWSIHEFNVTLSAYVDNEQNAGFKSVRQMLLGNCTLSDTVIKNSSGAVVANITDIPECEATIEGPQITENHGANTSQSVDSLVASLASAPNNEVYLANNAKLKFKATPDGSVAEANRTLQIEAKLVRTGTKDAVGNDEKASATININGTDTVINSSTAMYYNIPAGSLVDGKVNVEIKVTDMPSNYALSITNLKYAGYTAFEPTATSGSLPGGYTYITAVAINGGQPVGYGNTSATGTDGNPPTNEEIAADIKANDRVNVELTFNAPVIDVTTTGDRNTLIVNVNGNQGVYYFYGTDVQEDGNTKVSTDSNKKIALQVIAPKAAGNYTYEFVYTDADGNKASKVVNLRVTAKTSRR